MLFETDPVPQCEETCAACGEQTAMCRGSRYVAHAESAKRGRILVESEHGSEHAARAVLARKLPNLLPSTRATVFEIQCNGRRVRL
jgi:hypothetical protein